MSRNLKKGAVEPRESKGQVSTRKSASTEPLGPDPESFAEIAKGNLLFWLAVALLITLAVVGLLLALG